ASQPWVSCRNHRCNQTTFAMTHNAETVSIDILLRAQIGKSGADVIGEVGGRRTGGSHVRAAGATIVESQHRDAAPAESIRQLAERTKAVHAEERLVTLLCARPGDRDDRRRATRWVRERNRERSRERDTGRRAD